MIQGIQEADITEKEGVEESLTEWNRQMMDLINFLPDVTFAIDREGKVIAWNRAAEELTQVQAGAILGKGNYAYAIPFYGKPRPMLIDLVLHPQLPVEKYYGPIIREKGTLTAEAFSPSLRPGGGYLWGKASLLADSQGQVLGAIESVRDITDHKREAAELRQYRDHLEELVEERTGELQKINDRLEREVIGRKKAQMDLADTLARAQLARREAEITEARYRLLLESAPDGIMVVDGKGLIMMINAQMEKLFGYEKEELVGRPVETLVPETYRDLHVRHRAQYMESPHTRQLGSGLDLYGQRKDGTRFPLEISLSPSYDEQGLTVTAIVHDISKRKQAQDEVRRLNEDLKRRASDLEVANKELETFSYSVSHDLRAPLRGIDGFSQSILEDCSSQLGETCQDYLRRIRAASQHMSRLIDDILELSRVTRQEMRREPVDVSAMVQSIAAEFQLCQPERAVEFIIAPHLQAAADPILLRVALSNLLSNAWKFTSNHPQATIEVGAKIEDATTVFFVRDNGAGFDMTYAKKLFTPFQRLHTTREFPGTGVGLATIQRIIHRHGGRVWAQGEVEKGATFYFTLNGKTTDVSKGTETQ